MRKTLVPQKRVRENKWKCTVKDLLEEEPIGFPWFEDESSTDSGDEKRNWEPRTTGVQAMRRTANGVRELLVEWDPPKDGVEKFTWEPISEVPKSIREMFEAQQRKRRKDNNVARKQEKAELVVAEESTVALETKKKTEQVEASQIGDRVNRTEAAHRGNQVSVR